MHRTLILGVGSIGERHLRCFLATGRAEAGIVEPNPELRRKVAEKYGVKQQFAGVDEALGGGFDTAVVASPANTHIPLSTRLAGAGIHLLIEKPLSTSTDGIDALRRTLAGRSLVSAVAYVWRAHPLFRAVHDAVGSGRFGEVVQIAVQAGQHFPTFRPAYRSIYYKDRATGGGAIQDALTHMLNAGEWLAGPIDRLAADAAHRVLEGVEVEDTVNLIARQGEVLGSYSLNQHQAASETTVTVICRRGMVRLEIHRNCWETMTEPNGTWETHTIPQPERDEMFIRQANAFLDAVEGKCPPLCSLDEGAQTLAVNLAALKATESGRWEKVG